MRDLTPVALPPGRLRLATRPCATGSAPVPKTIGMLEVAALAASAPAVLAGAAITATCRRTRSEFDGHVAALDVSSSAQTLAECFQVFDGRLRRTCSKKPDHWHRLLCASRERPRRRRGADQRHELASPHGLLLKPTRPHRITCSDASSVPCSKVERPVGSYGSKSVIAVMSAARPLFHRKRKSIRDLAMSHKCQQRL